MGKQAEGDSRRAMFRNLVISSVHFCGCIRRWNERLRREL